MILDSLQLWMDPRARAGPESMAVDDWLLENVSEPLLRVYRWDGEWGSLGYFGKFAEARAAVSGVRWVRRRTGGGIVDHRADWTYSLVIPARTALGCRKGRESYRLIHFALAGALTMEGVRSELSRGESETGDAACFANPVCHDLIGAGGLKLAGGGQRRSRHGLLHQGSVAIGRESGEAETRRAEAFASHLSATWAHAKPNPLARDLRSKESTFASDGWTVRR